MNRLKRSQTEVVRTAVPAVILVSCIGSIRDQKKLDAIVVFPNTLSSAMGQRSFENQQFFSQVTDTYLQ